MKFFQILYYKKCIDFLSITKYVKCMNPYETVSCVLIIIKQSQIMLTLSIHDLFFNFCFLENRKVIKNFQSSHPAFIHFN